MRISIRLAGEPDVPELTRLIELSVRGLQAGDYSPAQLERALAVVYGVDTRLIADGTYFVAEAQGLKPQDLDRTLRGPEGSLFHGSSGSRDLSEKRGAVRIGPNVGSSGDRDIENLSPRVSGELPSAARDSDDWAETVIVGCGGWSRRRTLYGGDQFAGREDALLDPKTEAAKIRAFFVHPEWARRGIGGMILDACEKAAIAEGFRRLEMGATLTGVPFYKVKGYVELERVEAPLGEGLTLPIVRMGKEVSG